ncbi:hypothetical protein RFI_27207, partial [Reticulomyxa filosa]
PVTNVPVTTEIKKNQASEPAKDKKEANSNALSGLSEEERKEHELCQLLLDLLAKKYNHKDYKVFDVSLYTNSPSSSEIMLQSFSSEKSHSAQRYLHVTVDKCSKTIETRVSYIFFFTYLFKKIKRA